MSSKLKKLTGMQLFLPVFCMILVMAANIIYDAASGNFALNFFTISIRNGVLYGRLIDILKENPYVNVYNLQPGDEICIPTEVYEEEERRYYTAKVGETLGSLVEEFDTDIADLMRYNRELYDLRVPLGTIIRIPPEKEKQS